MPLLNSLSGQKFWALGLAWPVYHAGPDSMAKLGTPNGFWMIHRKGHPFQRADFAYELETLPIDYVEQHGEKCDASQEISK